MKFGWRLNQLGAGINVFVRKCGWIIAAIVLDEILPVFQFCQVPRVSSFNHSLPPYFWITGNEMDANARAESRFQTFQPIGIASFEREGTYQDYAVVAKIVAGDGE